MGAMQGLVQVLAPDASLDGGSNDLTVPGLTWVKDGAQRRHVKGASTLSRVRLWRFLCGPALHLLPPCEIQFVWC